ncbi:MAG: ATP-binding protein [Acidimicrobiales bacterium]
MIVLSGPSGAGKSTLAPRIADSFPMSVHLRGDAFWHSIRKGFVVPWLSGSEHQNSVILGALADTSRQYASGGYAVVLDAIVSPWAIDRFIEAATDASIALHYVILRPTVDEAIRRAIARPAGELVDSVAVAKVYETFSDLGGYEAHAMDTSGLSLEATSSALLVDLARGRFLLSGLKVGRA